MLFVLGAIKILVETKKTHREEGLRADAEEPRAVKEEIVTVPVNDMGLLQRECPSRAAVDHYGLNTLGTTEMDLIQATGQWFLIFGGGEAASQMRSMGMLFIEAARILIQVQDDRLGEGEMIDVEVEKEEEESVYVQGNKVNKSRPSWEELLQRLARMAHGEGAGHPGLMSALKQRIGQSLYLQTRGGVQLQAALVAITADKTEEAVEVCDTEENDETLVNYWSERLIEYMDLGNGTSSARGSDEFFGAGQRQHADNHLADPGSPGGDLLGLGKLGPLEYPQRGHTTPSGAGDASHGEAPGPAGGGGGTGLQIPSNVDNFRITNIEDQPAPDEAPSTSSGIRPIAEVAPEIGGELYQKVHEAWRQIQDEGVEGIFGEDWLFLFQEESSMQMDLEDTQAEEGYDVNDMAGCEDAENYLQANLDEVLQSYGFRGIATGQDPSFPYSRQLESYGLVEAHEFRPGQMSAAVREDVGSSAHAKGTKITNRSNKFAESSAEQAGPGGFKLDSHGWHESEDQLLTQAQRLVSYYLLYDIYRNDRGTERETATTPFVPLVVEMLETSYDGVERKFLLQFLSNPPKDLHKQTVNQFVQSCDPNDIPALPDLDMVRSMHQDGAPAVSASAALGIRPVIKEASDERYWVPSPLPPNSLGEDVEDVTGTESIELNPEELTMLSLEPCWARPVPPLLEPTVDEVFWLTPPHLLSEPLWDYTMCADTSLGSEVKELIAKAVKTQLQPQQIQIISDGLAQDAKLVYHCGLTPKKLPELVENNPQIAIEVLLKLMGGSQISGYFNALVNMEMSLHSMEAMNPAKVSDPRGFHSRIVRHQGFAEFGT
ncbi:cnot11 [Symbiodinium sp. KB8]|nr:cnot11 [Symbiodinium sp. KB8]